MSSCRPEGRRLVKCGVHEGRIFIACLIVAVTEAVDADMSEH